MVIPRLIGADTESHDGAPYSVQVSLGLGTALMVLISDVESTQELASQLNSLIDRGWVFVFHYAPADLPIFESMLGRGLDGHYRDTMLEAYGFAKYGKLGLKTLARRVLGRKRLSWEETVAPWSKEVLGQWMMEGFVYTETFWRNTIRRWHKKHPDKELKPEIQTSGSERMLRELFGYMISNPEYPIWEKLAERMPREGLRDLVEAIGDVPRKGIAHCPIEVQIEYACSDADDTRQLAVEFDRMRGEMESGLEVQDEDVDN